VSPRGDQPGFVQVLDENTIFIPERPGNNRIDTLTNIIENPSIGVFFMIPGYEECLRVTGTATLVGDQDLLEAAKVNGKTPKLGILIQINEAMLHCAKAVRRCKLWDPASIQDRSQMPTLGKMILEQTSAVDNPPSEALVEEVDNYVEHINKNELY
jgi:PPOX class probable FMN-dependent enzyme